MKNFKIKLAYDGSKYKGWQVQNSTSDTIQGKLENILLKLTGSPVDVIGSGRTDAGVHAMGQIANFHIELADDMSPDQLMEYINRYLPEDIAVLSLKEVDERFHARFSANSKTYRYRIHTSKIPNVFERKYVYSYLDAKLDPDLMKEAAEHLLGKHDFKAFCGNKHMKKSTVRTLIDIKIEAIYDQYGLKEVLIDYTGDGFLQNMIRILTGTLIEVGNGRISKDAIPAILNSKDRAQAGFTAPACGLCLMDVYY